MLDAGEELGVDHDEDCLVAQGRRRIRRGTRSAGEAAAKRPMCAACRSEPHAMPVLVAFAIKRVVRSRDKTCPKPQPPSVTSTLGVSRTTVSRAPACKRPFLTFCK